MLLLQLTVYLSLCAAGQSICQVFGVLHSSMNVTISSELLVKEITWIREINGKEIRFAKMKYGKLVDIVSSRYELFNNGRVLRIHNLTTNDCGHYIADMTLSDNAVIKEEFNLTVCEPVVPAQNITEEKSEEEKTVYHIPIITTCIIIVVALVVVTVLVWKCLCRKKSSNTTKQDDQSEENRTNEMKMSSRKMTGMNTKIKNFGRFLFRRQHFEQDDGSVACTGVQSHRGPSAKYFKAEKNQSSRIHLHTSSCDVPTRKEADEKTAQQLQEKEERDRLIQKNHT